MPDYFKLLDNFNRGDTTDPSSGGWPWVQTIHSGFPQSHDIVSNELRNASSGFCSDYWNESFGVDQRVEFTVRDVPSTGAFRCCMRMANPGVDATITGYEFEYDASNSYIVRVDPTFARTTIEVTGITINVGDRIRCECRANTLWMYRDAGAGFVEIGFAVDETYIRGGYVGFLTANDTDVAIDDFYAGDLGGPVFPQLGVLDSFDRANGDPGTNWSTAFVASPSKPQIDTNVLKSGTGTSANSGMYWNREQVPNGELYATISTLPSPTTEDLFLTFRAMNTGRSGAPPDSTSWSGYQVHYTDTFIILRKYDGASATTLYTSWSLPFAVGDGIGVSFYDDEIRVYWKDGSKQWAQIGDAVTDATYSGGYIGVEFDEGTCRVNNLGGGREPAFTTWADAVAALEPTSFWRFADGTLNDAGSSRRKLVQGGTLSVVNSIVPSEVGAASQAVRSNAAGYLQAPDSASYNFQDPSPDWSINYWMMFESTAFGTGFHRMFEKRDVNGDNRGYLYYGQGATYDTSFDVDPGAGSVEGIGMDFNLTLSRPHMMTVTYEASTGTMRAYKDGAIVSSKTDWTFEADLFPHNGDPFTIGSDSGGFSLNFIGVWDDFAVWDGRRLTDGEIAALYTAGSELPDKQTAYHYRRRSFGRR